MRNSWATQQPQSFLQGTNSFCEQFLATCNLKMNLKKLPLCFTD